MSLLFPTSPATVNGFDAAWLHRPIIYLAVAAICLAIALRFLRRALSPVGALIEAVAAAAVVAFTLVLAFAMVLVAAFMTVR